MNLDLLQLSKDLVAIRSVSRASNAEIANFLAEILKGIGFEIERLAYTDPNGEQKINLVARKGEGSGGLGFFSHSDTVPGQEEDWPAFDPLLKESRLYGRGSCDMKGPLAATIVAAAGVDAAQLKAPLFIGVTADEEIGCLGAKYVAEKSTMLNEAPPKYGVIAEPTRLIPVHAHKGYAQIVVTAYGKAAHTSTDLGISANFRIAPFLAEMAELAELFKTDASFMNHEFNPPTNGFNMTIDDGDCKINITAPKTVCRLGLRPMPNSGTAKAIGMIKAKAEARGFEVSSHLGESFYVAPDAEIIQTACGATGVAKPETVPYATDGFYLQDLMELVVLGPGDIAVAHTVGESVEVAQLERAVVVYRQMIEKLCM